MALSSMVLRHLKQVFHVQSKIRQTIALWWRNVYFGSDRIRTNDTPMIKIFFRILGLLTLALALITAVLDLTRSIADSAIVMTPLGQDWFNFSLSSLNLAQAIVQRYIHPAIWDPGIQSILQLPSWVVFGVLAMLFFWIGRRRKQNWHEKYGA